MNLREITIGRDRGCDIYLDSRCQYASRVHATIYIDGNQLMLRDRSSNGTMVNNNMIRNRAVPIHQQDSIMIAGRYPISWRQINQFFPSGAHRNEFQSEYQQVPQYEPQPQPPRTPNLSAFNWGAFFLYPIWGFFNGCWWAFLVWLFLSWWLPLVPNIMFGVCGNRWAWDNRCWASVDDFENTQKSWTTAGIIVFCVSLLSCIVLWGFLVAVYSSIAAAFLM